MSTLILNIETSGKTCSVCLGKDGQILGVNEVHPEGYVHAEQLNILIESLLRDNEVTMRDLDAVAVSAGPGSYTGLRIGVASAKGFCYALGIPLIALNSLEIMMQVYHQWFKLEEAMYVPMIDARRMEVYMAAYEKGAEIIPPEAKVIDETFMQNTKKDVVLFGDGADKLKELKFSDKIKIKEGFQTSASGMVDLSYQKYINDDFEDVAYFDPLYLKEFKTN
ncbi:tRNA (adenosine(37)-N6)-threonylcarbamoyltransferase complex dimerization subunit type 1 TsaB [Parvicella tangerina]|uniref:tRNA N6-adenosine threonylcarbamoyltransferase, mitochondrial n=1 Tax=Parvicella tangerina TaxID=2829795 RepID=A0A916JKM2_9FLAO|nr:tRNA (adenosine(37)-N6)-threonylcarbamoyltransferase complex dimerization subunit type 1 TsaB [Parvicella tangerina]CAG5077925.1 tRNA N6-adenosine threonylcarbamoyltransferase, mitochondrial [Parvicella tangerina]